MDARLKRLEEDSKEFRTILRDIQKDVSEIKGRVSAMPTTWQLIGLTLGILGAAFAIVRLALR
jgi:hypothetical protein